MRSRRFVAAIAGTAALALGLAGCGGGSSSAGKSGGNSTGGKKMSGSVSVAAVWSGPEQKSFEAVLKEFTKQTGIQASYKSTGDDIATYLGSQEAGGNPPDVAILPQPGLLDDLAKKKNLKSIGSEAEKNLKKDYAPYWKNLATVKGTTYGVYWKAANKSTWWYMTDLFKNAGITQPPKTWDDMLKDAKTMAAYGKPFVSIGGADGWPLTDWFENIYLRQAGPKMYDKLTNHQIPWTDPSVTKALKTFTQLLKTQGAVLGGPKGALQTTFDDSVNEVLTKNPKAATTYEGDFVPGTVTSKSVKAGKDYNFFDFPSVGGSGPAVVGGGDVAVTMTGTKQAQKLLGFLSSPDAAKVWAKRGGYISPNRSVPMSAYPDEISKSLAESVVKAADAGNLRFDMSDQAPPSFGGTKGRGEWGALQGLLRNPNDVSGVQKQLEKAAKSAYK